MAYAGLPVVPAPTLYRNRKSKVSCSLDCSAPSTSSPSSTDVVQETFKKFSYSRANPSVRWPHLKFKDAHYQSSKFLFTATLPPPTLVDDGLVEVDALGSEHKDESQQVNGKEFFDENDESLEILGRRSRTKAKKMTKLALKRAKDWRKRVQLLTDKILELKPEEFVADVLDEKMVQMTPTDYCFVVKWVGGSSWQRALEVYEWLNLRHWYSPNARMVATILSVLGKANQQSLAIEIFTRVEPGTGNTVQVYNAMMGVYARSGQFTKVKELLDLMRVRGCEPDLVSFNTLINARLRSGPMVPNLAIELLDEVRKSGLRPDIVTYNTLISGCSRESNLKEAVRVFEDMNEHKCQPDLWTYNAMISVFGRCGLATEAVRLFNELESKGFFPDAVTYNSMLYAFAKEGNVDKVKEIFEEMVKMGFGKDEMTYNIIIHMYGKRGQCDQALQLYRDMKCFGRSPDAVTYTVLIDSLGKASMVTDAANVMSEMLDAGVNPTLRTYSALICGYAKAGKRMEAEETFDCMLRSGIKPDHLAYSVMLDIYSRSNNTKKAMRLYHEMVRNGFSPDLALYKLMLRLLKQENEDGYVEKVIIDMKELCGLNPLVISSTLVEVECYDYANKMLRSTVLEGYDMDHNELLSLLGSFGSLKDYPEALELLNFLKDQLPRAHELITKAKVIMLCKSDKLDIALDEYKQNMMFGMAGGSFPMYECLIKGCNESGLFADASQLFSDMRFLGLEPSHDLYRIMMQIYCETGIPETAQHLWDRSESKGISLKDISCCIGLIEAYGKLKLLEKAESVVGSLRQRCVVDRKAWNALIQAYAENGCYERARAVFNTMMKNGPSPTVETINGLLRALIVDGRLNELYVVVQELQDMSFKMSKSSIILMLDAFAQAGNIFEVKKIYNGMRAAGYLPTMHLYRVMICLFCRGNRVRDVETMASEMVAAGFQPDLVIWNSMLKMYTKIEDFKEAAQVYRQIMEARIEPDEDTYNTLILMYCRDCRPEEGLSLMHQMRKLGLDPKLDTYKSLIAAFSKQLMVEQAEELFERLQSGGYKVDRSFYHLMMKLYRSSGNHDKAEMLLPMMKEAGIEPTIATMHLLMISYGSSGHPMEAEKVLNNLKSAGTSLSTLPYSSVIDAYLKNRDYDIGVQKLLEMKRDGLKPDHRVWTCFIRAASLCQSTSEALNLLSAIKDAGFDLPIRFLTSNSESLVSCIDQYLEKLEPIEDNAAFNFVNALEDLLWAFELRATASWVFHLAIKRNIYRHDLFRVADKDWGADFRKLSAGAALIGLTLWLDLMQDASLEGFPESPKSVVLITGTSEYNRISLEKTLRACLWEMGSPFLPCKTRTGVLVAKAHSLRMWLKDSPFCLDLELKNSPSLPDTNSMQLIEGCFIRRGLVSAYKDINERLGSVRPKKFAKLALLSNEKRDRAIQADMEGRKEKLEKMKRIVVAESTVVRRGSKKKVTGMSHFQAAKAKI